MAIDSETEVLALKMLDKFRCCFFESELKREAEAIFLKHNGALCKTLEKKNECGSLDEGELTIIS